MTTTRLEVKYPQPFRYETDMICGDNEDKKVVRKDWPEAEEWRFVSKKPDDWEPYCNRFPKKAKK